MYHYGCLYNSNPFVNLLPDMVAITRPVNELSQNLSFMMESLYKASVSLQRQEFV